MRSPAQVLLAGVGERFRWARGRKAVPPERIDPLNEPPGVVAHHAAKYVLANGVIHSGRVLDVGCGVGYGSALLRRIDRRVVGIDIAPEAVAVGAARYRRDGLAFARADGARLPFRQGVFDLVVCFEAIEHFQHPERHVAEVARVLKPSGKYILSTPRPGTGGSPGFNPHHYHEFDADELRQLLDPHFGHVRLLGQRRRQTLLHAYAQRADIFGIRRWKLLRPLWRVMSRLLRTEPFETARLEDFLIDAEGAVAGSEFVAVCRL